MDYSCTTTAQLLALASDKSDEAWHALADRTRPTLQRVAIRIGLSAEDADEVAQDALLQCWKALCDDSYNRERGRLRKYLVSITRNRAIDRLRKASRYPGARGDSMIQTVPSTTDELEELFEEEHRQKILDEAMDTLANGSGFSESTLRAFERVHFDGATPADVARELSVKVTVVHNSTSRCRRRLHELLEEFTELYELA